MAGWVLLVLMAGEERKMGKVPLAGVAGWVQRAGGESMVTRGREEHR